MQPNQNNFLLAQHRAAGMTVTSDEDFVYLNIQGKPPKAFSATGVTVAELRHEADLELELLRVAGRC